MWKFWRDCIRRSAADTRGLIGWRDWPRFIQRTGTTVLGLVLIALLGSLATAEHRAWIVMGTVLAGVIMAVLVFLYALLRAPYLAYKELLPRAPKNAQYGAELGEYFESGQHLLVQSSQLTNDDSEEWLVRFYKWCTDVEAVMRAKSPPDELFMFTSIAPTRGIEFTQDARAALNARVQKLRLIISRYLKPPE